MDGKGVTLIQNLNSLWFFSNVLASINPKQTQIVSNNNQNENTFPISKPSPPETPTHYQNQHRPNEHPPSPSKTTPTLKRSSKLVITISVEETENRDEGRSTRKQRSKRGWNKMREIRRAGRNNVDWEKLLMMGNHEVEEKGCGYDCVVKMPPYKDDEAMPMKKHLRSWAVVVAYTAVHSHNNTFMVAACS